MSARSTARSTAPWTALAAMALVGALVACTSPAGGEPLLTLDSAEASLRADGLAPQQRRVALWHRWDKAFPGRGGNATYTLQLPPVQPLGPRALFFEHVGNQVVVSVNGSVLRSLGRPGDAGLDAGKLSQVVVVPAALLRAGAPSELVIEATMQPLRAGGLAPVQFGDPARVEAAQAAKRLLEQSAAAAYAASFLLMGGLAAGLWWRQRDPLYGCFSLAALFGALRPLDHVSLGAPLPWPAWGAVLAMTYGCHLALIARFVLLVLGRQPVWLVRALYAVLAAVVLLASLSFALLVPGLWTAALLLLELLGLACFGVVLDEAVRARRGLAWLLLGAGALLLAAGTHDVVLVRMGLFGGSGLTLMPHAMFLLVLMLAGLVVARYSRSVSDYRALNEHLAERVAEREQQLIEAAEALRAQREQQAVLSERQRMMREIHDGVGSQLVGLLNMVHRPEVGRGVLEEHVRQALDEMRMAVDSLQPVHGDLATVLATLRYRLQPRLQAAGIEVVWEVDSLPAVDSLSAQAALQVQRILLEAFTNVLKHARASRVTVQAGQPGGPGGGIAIRLSDNGVGLAATAPSGVGAPPGQGLASMHARASAVGASLSVGQAAGGGTCVTIEWRRSSGSAGPQIFQRQGDAT